MVRNGVGDPDTVLLIDGESEWSQKLAGVLQGIAGLVLTKNCTLDGSPWGSFTTWPLIRSSAQISPLGVAMMPCIRLIWPLKFQPLGRR